MLKTQYMTALTFEQLENSLLALLNISVPGVPYFSSMVNVFYSTGCRPTELFTTGIWTELTNGEYQLQPLKGNNARIVTPIGFTDIEKERINLGLPIYSYASVRRIRYHFSANYLYPMASIGGKQAALYLFRHHFIKKLVNEGKTDPQIKIALGYTTESPITYYKNSVIEVPN